MFRRLLVISLFVISVIGLTACLNSASGTSLEKGNLLPKHVQIHYKIIPITTTTLAPVTTTTQPPVTTTTVALPPPTPPPTPTTVPVATQAPVAASGDLYAEWTRVADCEEGGWVGSSGSAYPDSLGIDAQNWYANGGGSDVSPAAQIAVAERLVASMGMPNYVPDQGGCAAW